LPADELAPSHCIPLLNGAQARMNGGLSQTDHFVTRNDLQLVYPVANRVQEHWQFDERKDKTPLAATIDQKAIDGFWASLVIRAWQRTLAAGCPGSSDARNSGA